MSFHPKPDIEGLQVCTHGGLNYAELEGMGILPADVMDFSAGCNPFGAPARIKEAFMSADIENYPDSDNMQLRNRLSEKLGISRDNILAGNGSVELIHLVARAFLDREDLALIIEPTFGEYEMACRIAGCRLLKQRVMEADGFNLRTGDTIALIEKYRPRAIFLCNPNNPTGQYLSSGEIEGILAVCRDSLLVLDEAYIAFVDDAWSSLNMIETGNLLILRSMTKDFALAGLRLGYAIAHRSIITAMRSVCLPWNVNAIAQQAGIIALGEEKFLAETMNGIRKAREFLVQELSKIGLTPVPTQADFFLVKVGDGSQFRIALLRQGILVRDCASFGLPDYVRIAVRTVPECKRLITAVKEIGDR